ncbi:MAG: class I SAM-dependent methyltransferase [Candidatus Andersenbacteria bacterium]|nr:class I SAM-dependent methyltransferase [Candidatus Andersenbacteria bacterium]
MYSGERILPRQIFNVTYQQSLKAYEFVEGLAAGKRVLDVACGEGYGLSLLAKRASSAVGVDYDEATIKEANVRYGSAKISFLIGNLFDLPVPLAGKKFDVVCCFQTIEHVQDHDAFLEALKAVTAPGGMVIVSTPNTEMFHSFNPYHVHEVAVPEFRALCMRHFLHFEVLGVFGDEAVLSYRRGKQKVSDLILKFDVLQARTWLPSGLLRGLYAFISFFIIKRVSLWRHYEEVTKLTTQNFELRGDNLKQALDFIAVGHV